MSHGKQFTLFTYPTGPNGWKVAIALEELGLTYEPVHLDFSKKEQKSPEYTKYNPNGRIPTLIDRKNGDFVIWESDAILLHLADKYDVEKKISVTGDERYKIVQWLFFQASGQAPYSGQAYWFIHYHPEKIPSAIERYQDEIVRVISVLDGVLAASPSGWLVGDKPTIADFSFVHWNRLGLNIVNNGKAAPVDVEKQFPAFYAWHQKLVKRDSVKKLFAVQASLQK